MEYPRLLRASTVKPGMKLNLSGDPYADPGGKATFSYDLATVVSVARDSRALVTIETEEFGSFGFPPNHLLRRSVVFCKWSKWNLMGQLDKPQKTWVRITKDAHDEIRDFGGKTNREVRRAWQKSRQLKFRNNAAHLASLREYRSKRKAVTDPLLVTTLRQRLEAIRLKAAVKEKELGYS